eukprot:15516316-Heterocapsa_arctica.AAC.1
MPPLWPLQSRHGKALRAPPAPRTPGPRESRHRRSPAPPRSCGRWRTGRGPLARTRREPARR